MPCVFERKYVWVNAESLDVERMRQAAELFLGEHDFSAFCANKKMKKSTLRRVDRIEIRQVGPELQLDFTGNGFLYNMVRIMVGTLVEVGRGVRKAETLPALFGARREEAGFLVPASGLCLMEVDY
jgi:tRNA pseudouridine38-40 synthase